MPWQFMPELVLAFGFDSFLATDQGGLPLHNFKLKMELLAAEDGTHKTPKTCA